MIIQFRSLFAVLFLFSACSPPVAKEAFFVPTPNPSPSTQVSRPLLPAATNSSPSNLSPTPLSSPSADLPPLRIQQNFPETDDNGKITDIQVTFFTADNKIKVLRNLSLTELASGFSLPASGLTVGVAYEASLTITRLKASCTHITIFKGAGNWEPPKVKQTQTLAFPEKTSSQTCENASDTAASSQSGTPVSAAYNAENDALIRQKLDGIFAAINQKNNNALNSYIPQRTAFYLNSMAYSPFYFQLYDSMEYKDLQIKHYDSEIQAQFRRLVKTPFLNADSILRYESTVVFKFKPFEQDWYLISAAQSLSGSLGTMRSPAAFVGSSSNFEKAVQVAN